VQSEIGVAGDEHPPFPCRDRLGGVEGEDDCIAVAISDEAVAVANGKRVSCILDDREVVAGGELAHRGRPDGHPGEVHRNHRLGARGEQMLSVLQVDVECLGSHIDDHGSRADITDDFGRSGERPRRHKHFVARPDAECLDRKVQAGCRGVHSDADEVAAAEILDELAFERSSIRSGGQPA
jgi:hypothetical protein